MWVPSCLETCAIAQSSANGQLGIKGRAIWDHAVYLRLGPRLRVRGQGAEEYSLLKKTKDLEGKKRYILSCIGIGRQEDRIQGIHDSEVKYFA